jgi:hypothetical protein
MKRAALYCRVSTVDQHPETQLLDLRQFAAQKGFQLVQEYVDQGICGARARRPALDKMMEDARRHKFDVLLVWSCDRLARSTKHLLQTLDELTGFGIQFLSQREANVSLWGHIDESDSGQVDDEFCHAHSANLRGRCQHQDRQRDARHALAELVEFVRREDASVLPVMGAIAATTKPAAAAELLGIAKPEFRRLYSRLRNLGQFFLAGKARLRRSTNPKPQCTHAYEIGAFQAAQSRIAWNRLELYKEVWDQPLVKLSRRYGISDVRLGKVCRKLKIPHPGRGYWAKRSVGQTVEQVPLPEFKDAPVVKRLKKKSKPKRPNRWRIVPQEGLCVKLCVKNF